MDDIFNNWKNWKVRGVLQRMFQLMLCVTGWVQVCDSTFSYHQVTFFKKKKVLLILSWLENAIARCFASLSLLTLANCSKHMSYPVLLASGSTLVPSSWGSSHGCLQNGWCWKAKQRKEFGALTNWLSDLLVFFSENFLTSECPAVQLLQGLLPRSISFKIRWAKMTFFR